MRNLFLSGLIALLLAGTLPGAAQEQKAPRLVVGIVVDQMRMDYLYRFQDKFGSGGFMRMMGDGFYLSNAHFNYMPTVTGPGHASVYTGTTPAVHGIIGNEWYEKASHKSVNCVEDSLFKPVGHADANGDVSPHRMLSSTITDELKLSSQKRARVIGISLKDRGAVLPAGHMPDGAYWYDARSGDFVTSTYYEESLPGWVTRFNQQKLPDKYLATEWRPLLPLDQLVESGPDRSAYESMIGGRERTFPYTFNKGDYGAIQATPYGNDLLTAFALAAVDGESMGKDDVPDFLCISFSSTDILGHAVGPEAKEIEDVYLRLDRNIAELLTSLDGKVGRGAYTVFLTADHGVADVPLFAMESRIPAGYFEHNLKKELNEFLSQYFKRDNMVENVSNDQIFLNHDLFQYDPKVSGIDLLIATELIGEYLIKLDGIANYFTKAELRQANFNEGGLKGLALRGYNPQRSGDITYTLQPQWLGGRPGPGTSHGSPYTYDTHVPIVFYGWGVSKGTTSVYHAVTDIAPTLSVMLKIKFPSGCTGQPISEMLDR